MHCKLTYSGLGDVIILLGEVARLFGIPRENLMNEDRKQNCHKSLHFQGFQCHIQHDKTGSSLISWRGVSKINVCSIIGVVAACDTACVMTQWRRET
jgi:hypothetical protein